MDAKLNISDPAPSRNCIFLDQWKTHGDTEKNIKKERHAFQEEHLLPSHASALPRGLPGASHGKEAGLFFETN